MEKKKCILCGIECFGKTCRKCFSIGHHRQLTKMYNTRKKRLKQKGE